ncbi:hypothetical protein GQ43DRAFT_479916 [Delitschia confertaspora ATCC 74209]|uniref:Uncharacterized protein n=1 Tax=Delitschia confertaspora ATCC 74209 TaxID=1513339 RepID=A0A9P4JSF7_9PLEO|nr:hypothetical protein GQ43DRAFT_479916 [Delitschia confertaspora ATCC 74209]
MDSMRSLNTSLPSNRRPDVHKSFRSAALTVTNLYKAALADIESSRSDGYQEALEDILNFLDKENIGVGDGEGWRVRQWATERLTGTLRGPSASDSDEEQVEERRARSSSPAMERNESPEMLRSELPQAPVDPRSDSAPPTQHESQTMAVDSEITPTQNTMFTFQSANAYPSISGESGSARRPEFASSRRSSNRASNRNRASGTPSIPSLNFNLGGGAGQKRKVPWNDFFNIDSTNERRDGSGGGPKRGRMA